MDRQKIRRAFMCQEGLIFTVMFTLIFILTNLIMIDYKGMKGPEPPAYGGANSSNCGDTGWDCIGGVGREESKIYSSLN